MTVRSAADGSILLEGACPSEDAETLLQHLMGDPQAVVDLRSCEAAHTAVVQVLMAFQPKVLGPPGPGAFGDWVYPQLILHK
jgi:hypothetical protein